MGPEMGVSTMPSSPSLRGRTFFPEEKRGGARKEKEGGSRGTGKTALFDSSKGRVVPIRMKLPPKRRKAKMGGD